MRIRPQFVLALSTMFVLALALSASAATLTATENRTFNVAEGAKLVLDNQNGGVTISSWDRPQIQIEAEKSARGSQQKAKEALGKIRLEMAQKGNTVEIRTRYDDGDGIWSWFNGNHVDHSVTYTVMVPRNCNISIETVNGGVKVTGVAGELDLETTNGSIRAVGTSGTVRAGTTNGSIDVELLQAQSRPMSMSTTNGKIVVRVPPTFRANVDASTTNGSIKTDLPITVSGKFDRTTLRGEMNGGGPKLELETTNGSIQILKSGA